MKALGESPFGPSIHSETAPGETMRVLTNELKRLAEGPGKTAGNPDQGRKDDMTAGPGLQTRIQKLVAELQKKYTLPRPTK